jgi:hypothetical protein
MQDTVLTLPCAGRPDLHYVAAMRKGEDAEETVRAAIADLWLKGGRVTWQVPKAGSAHTGELSLFCEPSACRCCGC